MRHLRRKRVFLPLSLAVLWIFVWFLLPFLVPLPPGMEEEPPSSPILVDRHGMEIHRLTLGDLSRSEPVTLSEIPDDLVQCMLAAEDKRFWSHGGIDGLATLRAIKDLVGHRRIVSGASTLTQQLVKISSPPSKRTLKAKIRETLAARRLEMTWSKEQILIAYLNRVEFGNRRRGVSAAARHLFQKPLSELSLAECALLAGLPQAPTRYNPLKRPVAALHRRNVVLSRLAQSGRIDPHRITLAMSEKLNLRPLRKEKSLEWMAVTSPGTEGRIQTTIDLPLQREVEQIVREELAKIQHANVQHAAVVILRNTTGEILSLVSSGDWNNPRDGQINGALTPRSPGSALKPFTYLLSFEKSARYPGSIIADIPTRFRTPQGLNLPENYDHSHRGPVSIRTALACSLNVPAMRELDSLGGPGPLHTLLTRLGMHTVGETAEPYGLGLTIGNAPVRLLDLTNAYATLARGGVFMPPSLYRDVPSPASTRMFSNEAAWLIADILSDSDARAPAFGHHGPLNLPFRCAAKTGTSSNFRDNWCIGFTADFTVGVWAGNFDNTPMKGVSGVTGAGPIFHRAMIRVQKDSPTEWTPRPEKIVEVWVDRRNGRSLSPSISASFVQREYCHIEHPPAPTSASSYSSDGRALLDATYKEWFDSADNRRRNEFLLDQEIPSPERLKILFPHEGITCLLDPELPSGGRKLRLASTLPGIAQWSSPTLSLVEDSSRSTDPSVWLEPGTHTLTVTDPRTGASKSVTIQVRSL